VDGKALKYRAIEVAIFNSGIMAKTLYPKGPDIRIDDGHLDVWIMGIQTILDYPGYLFEMITGNRQNGSHILLMPRRCLN